MKNPLSSHVLINLKLYSRPE